MAPIPYIIGEIEGQALFDIQMPFMMLPEAMSRDQEWIQEKLGLIGGDELITRFLKIS